MLRAELNIYYKNYFSGRLSLPQARVYLIVLTGTIISCIIPGMNEKEKKTPQPKETSQGLPVVSGESIKSIFEIYNAGENWGQHLEEVKMRLIKENPNLASFIESRVGQYPPSQHVAIFSVVVETLAALEHQAMANKLSSEFNLDQDDRKN
jgi:hypothetical protein